MQHFFSFSRKHFCPNFEINLSRSIEFTNSIIDEDGENEKGREERGEIGAVSLEAERGEGGRNGGRLDGLNEVLLVYRKIKRIRRELLAYYSFNRS